MVICTSQVPEDIVEILNGAVKGTKFHPLPNSLKGRKRWLLTGAQLATFVFSSIQDELCNRLRGPIRLGGVCIGSAASCRHSNPNATAPVSLVRGPLGWCLQCPALLRLTLRDSLCRVVCCAAVPLRGSIWLDDGAVRAVRDRHKSLFPVGVIKVVGDFSAQVRCAV